MNRVLEVLLIVVYNLILLAGASYLVYYKDASAWVFAVAILFGASWKEKEKNDAEKVQIG